jgi:uncharacterized protein YcgL (UPF0745 family)
MEGVEVMNKQEIKSFPAAVMDYFGKKPGQSNLEFMQELRALTDEDKAELRELLKGQGYPL